MSAPSEKIFACASLGDVEQLRTALKGNCDQKIVRKALKAAARNGHIECLQLLMTVSDQGGIDRGLCEAAKYGEEEAVKILLKKAKPLYDNSRALMNAAMGGHISCLHYFVDNFYSKHPESIAEALGAAAHKNQELCVDLLLPYVQTDLGKAARLAAQCGHISILEKLLVHCAPSEHLSCGLRNAFYCHHRECARRLIGLGNSRELNGQTLSIAFERSDWEFFDLLIPYSDIEHAYTRIGHDKYDDWERALARRQHTVLQECVETGQKNARGRKI